MIRKAQPKEGLETGGLISGSEAARARIAAEYEPDLSGANGPTARFDTLRELINTEIGAAQNEMTFASGDGSQIFGRDGKIAVHGPTTKKLRATEESSRAKTPYVPWRLLPGSSAGEVVVDVGTILQGSDSISAQLTCSNPTDEFSPGDGDYLAIKIEDLAPTTYELVLLSSWPEASGMQVSFTGTLAAGTFAFTARHYPLWVFTSTSSDQIDYVVGAGLYGVQLTKSNLQIVQGHYRTPDGEFPQLPEFSYAHRAG